MNDQKLRILFLCTGNSCRSQMAEGFCNALKGETIEADSAGIMAQGVNPHAATVMQEAGVDISGHTSKTVDQLDNGNFDYVITVCDHADESCPFFPGPVNRVHKGFDDPPILAASARSEEEILEIYRRVRDEIREYIQTLPESLSATSA
ncbi:MAG: arsenate reductase ArsC [Desulfarculaceae bacterium]|nr:arsenate reductase ArsC [Desulfarculaceae bacterium]